MSEPLTPEQVRETLSTVIDTDSGRSVIELNLVRQIAIGETIRISYGLPQNLATESFQRSIREQTVAAVRKLGAAAVEVDFSVVVERTAHTLPGVTNVVAVGAGKGGVGKSTVALLLAVALKRLGKRTGLLDADVYGPSQPKMTGTEGQQPAIDPNGRLIPVESGGIPLMSMGYFVSPDQAVVWRGPMTQKYVKDMLDRTDWGTLDYLLVDLPPGTGDVPLTLAQSIPLTGAVVVCTPQDLALLDARKAVRMYQKLGVTPLGLVENMSYYLCPQCGHRAHIFDHGGVEKAAEELAMPFLGGIPLTLSIRTAGDTGEPAACFDKSEPYVRDAIESVAKALAAEVDKKHQELRPLPKLNIT